MPTPKLPIGCGMHRARRNRSRTSRYQKPQPRHPMQPLVIDSDGVVRFKVNAIVRHLLDQGPFDLNTIAAGPFSAEDRIQFAQLIGYSVSGFGELSYVPLFTARLADQQADELLAIKKGGRS